MFLYTRFHVTSQCHDVKLTLSAIQCDSLCANCQFLKTDLVDNIDVLQTPARLEIIMEPKALITQATLFYSWYPFLYSLDPNIHPIKGNVEQLILSPIPPKTVQGVMPVAIGSNFCQ